MSKFQGRALPAFVGQEAYTTQALRRNPERVPTPA